MTVTTTAPRFRGEGVIEFDAVEYGDPGEGQLLVPITSRSIVAFPSSIESEIGKKFDSCTSSYGPYPPSFVKPMSARLFRH